MTTAATEKDKKQELLHEKNSPEGSPISNNQIKLIQVVPLDVFNQNMPWGTLIVCLNLKKVIKHC